MRGPPLAASVPMFLMHQLAVDRPEASSFLLPANTNGALQGAKSRRCGSSDKLADNDARRRTAPRYQMSTTSTHASARPRRSIDQSRASRPNSRSTVVLRANKWVSNLLSKKICPLFDARYFTLGIALVFAYAPFRAKVL